MVQRLSFLPYTRARAAMSAESAPSKPKSPSRKRKDPDSEARRVSWWDSASEDAKKARIDAMKEGRRLAEAIRAVSDGVGIGMRPKWWFKSAAEARIAREDLGRDVIRRSLVGRALAVASPPRAGSVVADWAEWRAAHKEELCPDSASTDSEATESETE